MKLRLNGDKGGRDRRSGRVASSPAHGRFEALEGRLLLATFAVTNINDSGAGSLREAINQSNNTAGTDTIAFNIPSASKVIRVTTELPGIWDPAIIDGTTQPGYAGSPLVQVQWGGSGSAVGLKLFGSSTIKGLSITNFPGDGINIPTVRAGLSGNVIKGNWIGIDLSGNAAGNSAQGVGIYTSGNTIGGPGAGDRNVIGASGGQGVYVYGSGTTNNLIQNNYIGLNPAGSAARANTQNGVGIQDSPGNRIIGNVISGNAHDGIILIGSAATSNVITGNTIGLDATGANAIGNSLYGIEVQSANNTIGGATAAERNVISANAQAGIVFFLGSATGNLVQGNYIGTDASGMLDRGNAFQGIAISNANGNTIKGNWISGNNTEGIGVFPGNNNVIQGNWIGLTAINTPLANGTWAITLQNGSTGNIVGGTGAGQPNLISDAHPSGTIYNGGGNTVSTNTIVSSRDTTPPGVLSMEFVYAVSPQTLKYVFGEDVSASLGIADLSVKDTTTLITYVPGSVVYDKTTNTATFSFAAALPNGVFQATLSGDGVTDGAGNKLDGDNNGAAGGNHVGTFFYLAGDATRDAKVDFDDLLILSQNYNRASGMTWTTADFTGDGKVDFDDLLILSQNYNAALTLPGDAMPAAGTLSAASAPAATSALASAETATKTAITTTASGSGAASTQSSSRTRGTRITRMAPRLSK